MNSFASVHAERVVINSICDGVGFIDPRRAREPPAALAGMNSTAGTTLFVSVPAQPEPEHLQRNLDRSGRFFIVGYDADII
jgi:hypothetical protein